MSADVDLGPGSRIDRYEIVRAVATGGMGQVWLARVTGKHGFERPVAIKTIRAELATDPQVRTMLLDEARICTRLQHRSVAQILDVGEHGQLPYVVFEWVDGPPLADLFSAAEQDGRPVPLLPLLRVLADVCDGLHAAHELTDEQGKPLQVVHRDVTPSNILVARGGFAKVIDFGVARARERIAVETRSGIVKGTPQYMAPEQAQGARVDRRADVWAIGAVLYRGLGGGSPFKDRFALEAFVHRKMELDPLPESVPADVRAIVARALHRDPAERFPTAAEMAFAIERVLRAADARPSIADLFPPDERPSTGPSEQATEPDRTPLAPATPLRSTPAATVARAGRGRGTAGTSRDRPRTSSNARLVLAAAIAAAAIAITMLAWTLAGR